MNQRNVRNGHSDVTNDPDRLQGQDLLQTDDAVNDEEDDAQTFDALDVVDAAATRANATHYDGIVWLLINYL